MTAGPPDATAPARAPIDAFISYRRSDGTAAARRIRQMLQAYRLPRSLRAMHPGKLTVFLDTAYERGAADFYENTIRPALVTARWLVVVATPDAVRRPAGEDWIAREVADFSAGPRAGNVIVVRAVGEFLGELPADIGERYPHVQIVDLRDPGLAARISPQRAARLADEKLKLVGPLCGIALEDMPRLRREEERRQVSRLGALAGAVAATVILVAGLSLFALKSQWDGSQALKQSFNAARESVVELVGGYGPEEPLNSPIRDVVLQNCDLANRMRILSGSPEDPDQQLACLIEEQRALAMTGQPEQKSKSLKAIGEALKIAEARADAPSTDPSNVGAVVLSGLRTWMALDPSGDAKRRYAAYRRGAGLAQLKLAEGTDSVSPETDLRSAVEILQSASQASYDLGVLDQQAGDQAAARTDYAQAMADALKTDEALQHLHRLVPADAGIVGYWSTVADLVQQAAVGETSALAPTDKAGARAALTAAMTFFSRPATEDFATPSRQAARRAAIAGALYALEGDPAVGEPIPQALWDCLESGHLAVSDAAVAQDDYDRQQGSRVLGTCLDSIASITDARRAEVYRLWTANELRGGAKLLRLLIADATRVNQYREYRGPWDDLYIAIATRQLALFEQTAGNLAAARQARDAALALFRPYLPFDQIDDTARHVAEARAAYDDLMHNPGL